MKREKKKSWKDYEYCSYQFRIDENEKKELDLLINQAVVLINKGIKPDEKKTTKGEVATKLLKQALTNEIRRFEK